MRIISPFWLFERLPAPPVNMRTLRRIYGARTSIVRTDGESIYHKHVDVDAVRTDGRHWHIEYNGYSTDQTGCRSEHVFPYPWSGAAEMSLEEAVRELRSVCDGLYLDCDEPLLGESRGRYSEQETEEIRLSALLRQAWGMPPPERAADAASLRNVERAIADGQAVKFSTPGAPLFRP